VENIVEDADGKASLKLGAKIEVMIEAAPSATKPKA
jgi:hypothetical protein